ncbi:MAG: hypothetical protein HKL89_04485 [Candidatus Dormibacteraeota bacterium]|nr:hypothetical protein [Candidatus Dormibacteraeota bacterium]
MDDVFDLDVVWEALASCRPQPVLPELTDRADQPARTPARARFGADLALLPDAPRARVLVNGDPGVGTDGDPGPALTTDALEAWDQYRQAGHH